MKIILKLAEDQQQDEKYQSGCIYYQVAVQDLLSDINVLLYNPEVILICDKCLRKLNSSVSVLYVTPGQRKDYCFTCFFNANKLLERKSYYYVRPNLNLTFTDNRWSILSQLMLLQSLHRYNYGNWVNIKNYMDSHGFNYSQEEIEQHYKTFYIPSSLSISKQEKIQPIFLQNPIQIEDQEISAPQFSDPDETCLGEEIIKPIQAYNPKRQEYLFDYDPEAEDMVANLEFFQTDTPQEVQLKMQLLERYDHRIKQRKKRQQFVTEHKLLTEQYRKKLIGSKNANMQIRLKMSCFSRYMSYRQSQNLIDYLKLQSSLSSTVNFLNLQRRKSNQPFFERAYQNMKKIKQKKNEGQYRGGLTIHAIEPFEGKKRGLSVMTVEEMRKRLKQTKYWKDSIQITNLNDN